MELKASSSSTRTAIHRREWRWVAAISFFILAFTCLPYLLGWGVAAASDTGLTFGGFVIGVEDGNSYLAKMAQGARGHWLFHIVYTSESHDGALLLLFYILLGKLAALLPGAGADLPLRLIWAYHLARLVCGAGLLAMIYRFVAEFLPTVGLRRLAWLMIALGGGLGWLLLALDMGDWLGSPPLDLILPEGFTFLTIFLLPHIALGRTLLLGGVLIWLEGAKKLASSESRKRRTALWAGVLWLGMGMIVPFYPLVAGMVVGGTLLAWGLLGRRFPGREVTFSLLAGVILSPVVLYSAWVFTTNPVMAGWAKQNLILSPPLPHYLVAYLLPALLAAAGVLWVWRERPDKKYWLLVAWLLVVPPLLYAPFNFQRRLIEGYQVPLCTLAALGAGRVIWPRLRSRFPRPRLLAAALLLFLFPSSLMLVAGSSLAATAAQAPIYHSSPELGVAAWLADHASEGDLLLSGYSAGNFMPAWAPVRVYYGHGSETVDLRIKEENVLQFYAAETDDEWRRSFLRINEIDYVLHGPGETALGAFQPEGRPYLQCLYEQDGWALYKVKE